MDASEGLVKFVGIAPEDNADAVRFIEQMKDKVRISLAHTNADMIRRWQPLMQERAMQSICIMLCQHLRIGRRGVIGAVSDSGHVMAELICDGVHIHPSVVRATFKMMGEDRMILISDSMRRPECRMGSIRWAAWM